VAYRLHGLVGIIIRTPWSHRLCIGVFGYVSHRLVQSTNILMTFSGDIGANVQILDRCNESHVSEMKMSPHCHTDDPVYVRLRIESTIQVCIA
jgi:hypothetical protein